MERAASYTALADVCAFCGYTGIRSSNKRTLTILDGVPAEGDYRNHIQ